MLKISKNNKYLFSKLDDLCRQITPYLAGELAECEPHMLIGQDTDLSVIQALYFDIQTKHPNAGRSYWLTRTWELLFWQPIYISMVCVYELQKQINFSGFAQHKKAEFIMGYRFQSLEFIEGETTCLIQHAGEQIKALLSHYRELLDDWLRCRAGFTDQLLADFILASLKLLGELKPEIPQAMIKEHAAIWLSAFDLPLTNLNSYSSHEDGTLHFIRRSCCMVYKTESGKLCNDCPRVLQRKLKREQKCIN